MTRILLLLYPKRFRKDWGEEMLALVGWRLERARRLGGGRAWLGAWLRLTGDLLAGAVLERLGRRASLVAGRATPRGKNQKNQTGGGSGMDGALRDVTEAVRRAARAPLFSLTVVVIVALGIGANTAVFTIFNALLLKPAPFEDPDRLVHIYQDSDDGEPNSSSFPAYRDMAATQGVFAGVAADLSRTVTWEVGEEPRPALIELVTASYLPVLGLSTTVGRWFQAPEDHVGAGFYAVVSHHTWTSAMGADPGAVGRTVRLNGQPVTIVGVGPQGFHGSGGAIITDFWLSISTVGVAGSFYVQNLDRRQDHWYDVVARLAPGVTREQAQAAMDRLALSLGERFPELNRGRDITIFGFDEVRFHPDVDAGLYPTAAVLMTVVALVLLLACSNLANLLLVRGMGRIPEVAVRRALGASRAAVARLFLGEALLLSGLGGLLGLFFARWAVGFVLTLPLPLYAPSGMDLSMDHRVFLFNGMLVLVTGTVFGLIPALRSGRVDVTDALKEGARSVSQGRGIALFRGTLLAVQVAVSAVLLVGAALATRSLGNLRTVDPGVDSDRIAYVATSYAQAGLTTTEGSILFDELKERVRGLPGVADAEIASRLPVGGTLSSTTVVEGYQPPSGTGSVELPIALVGEAYFATMGIPVLQGRAFTSDDRVDSERVVLVNRTAAERFWPGLDPIGRRIRPQAAPDRWSRVVGVVEDVRIQELGEPPRAMYYIPLAQSGLFSPYLVVRTDGDPRALVPVLRRELRAVSPALPVTELGTLEAHLGETVAMPRVAAALMGAFSLLAVLLATMGIYGVVSYGVARRASEIGIRIALGAGRLQMVGMVVREVVAAVVVGLAAGLGLAVLAAPVVERGLYGVAALDPGSFAAVALLLTAVAAVASWLPARRAAGADPVEALRME